MIKKTTKPEFEGVSLILPALNEAENLRELVPRMIAYGKDLAPLKYEIIVVDDGSKDETRKIVDELKSKHPEHIVSIHNARNRGYGFAIRQGINHSRYDLIFFTDSDGQFDIEDLNLLLPLIQSGVPDIVIGYRIDRKDPWNRLFLSGCYNLVVRFLFDVSVKDVDCAFKLFRKDIFNKIKIGSRNFFINTEILAKAVFFGYRILEVGVDHLPRSAGTSTVSLKHMFVSLRELVRIWFEMRPLRKQSL